MPEIEFLKERDGGRLFNLPLLTSLMLAPKEEASRGEFFLFFSRDEVERPALEMDKEREERYRHNTDKAPSTSNLAISKIEDRLELISVRITRNIDRILWQIRDAPASPIGKEIDARRMDGLRAGAIFLELLRQSVNSKPVKRENAVAEVARRGRGIAPRGWSTKTLNNAFDHFRPVCHIWAALIDLKSEDPAFDLGRRGILDLSEMPRLLARAETFRDAGLSIEFSERKGALTILSADDTWHVSAHIRASLPQDD